MSLTSSKRFIGWANAHLVVGGITVPIPGLTACQFMRNAKPLLIDGDLDMFASTGAVVSQAPTFKVTTNKPAALDAIAAGPCSFYVERWDATNLGAAGGGGMSYSVAVALFIPDDQTGGQRAEGVGSFTIQCIAPDGVTNPVAVAAL